MSLAAWIACSYRHFADTRCENAEVVLADAIENEELDDHGLFTAS